MEVVRSPLWQGLYEQRNKEGYVPGESLEKSGQAERTARQKH